MSDTKDSTRTAELASQLAARRYGYGYGHPGMAAGGAYGHPAAGYGAAAGYGGAHAYGALSPHRSAYYGMSEHLRAEERFLVSPSLWSPLTRSTGAAPHTVHRLALRRIP